MKMKLHKTKNDLREKTRRAMIDLLNQELADVLDLGLQAKQAHWNVKGPHFIGLHELFDKVAEELEELTDDMAERAVEVGGVALVDGFVNDVFLADPGKCVHKQCQASDFADQLHAVSAASGCSFARVSVVDRDLSKSLMRTMR